MKNEILIQKIQELYPGAQLLDREFGGSIVFKYNVKKDFDKIIKASYKNPATKGLYREWNTLNKLFKYDYFPKVFQYKSIYIEEVNEHIEILELEFIEGEVISAKVIQRTKGYSFPKFFNKLTNIIKLLYDNGICHGDIKKENILFCNKMIFLIDFDQSFYITKEQFPLFSASPDMSGNIYSDHFQMNLNKLKEQIINERHKINGN